MTPNKPYLLRALYDWIIDNGLTPHLVVDAQAEGVNVPQQAVQEGRLVLNIAPQATRKLELGNESLSFQARFGGVSREVFLPIDAVTAIYARENGQGMMFARDSEAGEGGPDTDVRPLGSHLKLIK